MGIGKCNAVYSNVSDPGIDPAPSRLQEKMCGVWLDRSKALGDNLDIPGLLVRCSSRSTQTTQCTHSIYRTILRTTLIRHRCQFSIITGLALSLLLQLSLLRYCILHTVMFGRGIIWSDSTFCNNMLYILSLPHGLLVLFWTSFSVQAAPQVSIRTSRVPATTSSFGSVQSPARKFMSLWSVVTQVLAIFHSDAFALFTQTWYL